jgi:toxin ParE1/3/4
VTTEKWTIRLSGPAQRDFRRILSETTRDFGENQASAYRELLLDAIANLQTGPDNVLSRARNDVRPGLWFLHVARRGRHGRHNLVYRVTGEANIEIIRILHDAMDFARHLPSEGG